MFSSTPKTLVAALAVAFGTIPAQAEFTSVCPKTCFKNHSLLVAKCTVDGTPKGTSFMWSQFDLNNILKYNSTLPGFQYILNGNAFVNGCDNCSVSGSVLTCDCATIDLNSNMVDVVGSLCFANNEIGPICSPLSNKFAC